MSSRPTIQSLFLSTPKRINNLNRFFRTNSCPDTRLDPAIQTDYETALVILTQVHAVVETRNLVGIAVEHEGLALQEFAQAALRGLAPTGMIHSWIHIGVETIFVWSFFVPTRRRLAIHEFDFHNGLDALETILPGDHHANGRAILVGKRFDVN